MTLRMLAPLAVAACVMPYEPGDGGRGKGDFSGTDDRIERYQIEEPALRQSARSSAALVLWTKLTHDRSREVWTTTTPQLLGERLNLCDSERFTQQPTTAHCSATLVADDVVVSAGHCFSYFGCQDVAVVFDYAYDAAPADPVGSVREFPASSVYRCTELLLRLQQGSSEADYADYAVFRLDRSVTDRSPVQSEWSEPFEEGARGAVIGHPTGLPQKFAPALVASALDPSNVYYDADTAPGSSGSGLFDADGRLRGIHSGAGGNLYVAGPTGTCNVMAVCGENIECKSMPHACSLPALKQWLSPELLAELGAR